MNISRRRLIALTAGGVAAATGLYTWLIEPHWVEIVERKLPVANLPDSWQNARLVHLSDLHIGPQVSDSYLLHCFDLVNALSPDVVAFTGDFITFSAELESHAKRIFPHLPRGRRATFGSLGNHDFGPGFCDRETADTIAAFARDAGVRMLRNEAVDVDGLQFAGFDDLWSGCFNLKKGLSALKPNQEAIALSHNPDTVDRPGWENFKGWILSGHTHGGQCKPPFLPPPFLSVQNRNYVAGEYPLPGNRRMYISRGVGHLIQARFCVRPEIAVFRLERATV